MSKLNREQYEALRKIGSNPEALDMLEKSSPGTKDLITAVILNRWFPVGWSRRVMMAIILIVALLGSFSSFWFLSLLLLLPLFSPRIAGEIVRFIDLLK